MLVVMLYGLVIYVIYNDMLPVALYNSIFLSSMAVQYFK